MAAGRLDVHLGLSTAEFTQGLTRAELEAQKFNKRMVAIGSAIGTFLGQHAVAASRQLADTLKSMVSEIDNLAETAQGLQMTAVELSNFRIGAEEAGVGAEKFDMAIGKLNAKIADAVAGGKDSVKLFNALGISIKDAAGNARPASAVLGDLADKFQRMEQGPAKAALAYEIFGEKVGRQMVTYLSQGSAGLQKFSGLTNETVKAAETMQAEFDKFNASLTNIKNTILGGVIPAINKLNDLSKGSALGGAGQAGYEVDPRLLAAMGGNVGLPGKAAGAMDAFLRGQDMNARAIAEGLKLSGAEAMEQALKGTVSAQKILDGITNGAKQAKAAIDENATAFAAYVNQLAAGMEVQEGLTEVQKATRAIEQSRFGVLVPQQKELLLLLAKSADETKHYQETVDRLAVGQNKVNAENERFTKWLEDLKAGMTPALQELKDLDLALQNQQITLEQFTKRQREIAGFDEPINNTADAARELGMTFTSAFENAVVEGENLRSVLDGLAQDLLRITTRKLVTEPFADIFSGIAKGLVSSAGGGDWLSGLLSSFSGSQSLVGVFASGTDFVPQTGLAMVHRGEAIVPANENHRTKPPVVINYTFNGPQDQRTMSQANADLVRRLNIANVRNN